MRTVPPLLVAWLATKPTAVFIADLVTITLGDGATVYRWTTAEVAISVGGNTYQTFEAVTGNGVAPGIEIGEYVNQYLPAVDTLGVTLTGGSIGGKSLGELARQGYFDFARIRLDKLLGPDPQTAVTWGGITSLFEGRIGLADPQGMQVVLTCDAETVSLNQQRPLVVLQPSCNYTVYDANCMPAGSGLTRAGFTLSGAASGVPTTKTIPTTSAALTAKAAGYFDLGVITFTSGALIGTSVDVETWDGTTFTLAGVPPAVAPAAGDTFTVYPGCPLTRAGCAKFTNIGPSGHWRGFDRIPSSESGSN